MGFIIYLKKELGMRKIDETLAVKVSILVKSEETGTFTVGGNTVVVSTLQSIAVKLHGSTIANYDKSKGELLLDNCGHSTNVTVARLNAVLNGFETPYFAKIKNGVTLFVSRETGLTIGEDKVTLIVNNH